MVMSSKKIGRMVDTDVDKALANIGANAPKMDMKSDETAKAAAAPSRDMTRGEAFRYARMAAKAAGLDPSKQTFPYKGKVYSTRMAGEGVKRPAATTAARPAAPTPPPKAGNTPPPAQGQTPKIDSRFLSAKIGSAPAVSATQKDTLRGAIERRNKLVAPKREPGYFERMTTNIAARNKDAMAKQAEARKAKAIAERGAEAKRDADAKKRAAAFRKANPGWEYGAKLPSKAKGGSVRSVDGCAVRGKTRAMKKGK